MAERRKNIRAVVQLEVEGEKRLLLRVPLYVTANLSRGGMFLITTDPLKEGTQLNLSFSTPGDKRMIKVTGEVVWARDEKESPDRPPGMGIRFLRIEEKDREHIGGFVEELSVKK
jgi:uncharacterized protein (TIGR02266 family)